MERKYSPRLERALEAARQLSIDAGVGGAIGAEHLVRVLLDDENAIPTQVIRATGHLDHIRSELDAISESSGYSTPTTMVQMANGSFVDGSQMDTEYD